MEHHITGSFTVRMLPQAWAASAGAAQAAGPAPDTADTHGLALGRALLDKQYQGALQATARGQMLSAVTPTAGSAGYVAIEQVVGTLQGRSGSFVLQHHATMHRGVPQLAISVVPDSGTGELQGLGGRLGIRIEAGQHFYDFDYTLP